MIPTLSPFIPPSPPFPSPSSVSFLARVVVMIARRDAMRCDAMRCDAMLFDLMQQLLTVRTPLPLPPRFSFSTSTSSPSPFFFPPRPVALLHCPAPLRCLVPHTPLRSV